MKHTLVFALLLAAGCRSAAPAPAPAPVAAERPASVKPGINDAFLSPDLDVDQFVQRFETESREIYVERAAIAELCGLRPGQSVADIGAGTGLFTFAFAERVGAAGRVYAVDIAAPFVERLSAQAAERGMAHVEGVVCAEDDVRLPPRSVDVAFICDTYHHFEYPAATMASLHRAMKPGAMLVVIDFERIEGVSREWVLGHVRAGREVVTREIEAAGFEYVDDPTPGGLKENYALRFRRR